MKDALAIAVITCALIGGAITGIVGGAMGMSVAAAGLHLLVDSGK